MKAAVVVFPGVNRDRDVARALKRASGSEPVMVWHTETSLPAGTDLAVLPGGFSYGDYLRCGAIAARSPVMDAVRAHAARGGKVLAICNGFQVACEAGLLPGVLMRNADLHFVCRMQHLRVERTDTPFTSAYAKGQVISVPVAHGEGNYAADDATIERLEGEGRVAFRYCGAEGDPGHAASPNGSRNHIAGIYSENLNVLGMMPHPENAIEVLAGGEDGKGLFDSLVG
jgi:phosphoribosylformylglycinamidine synthase subunit PurQ / glutaminase